MQIFSNNINYTDAEKDVISYINQNINNIDDMTITDLAKKSHTSNATIIRLSHKVGCTGFKTLKVKIIKSRENNQYLKRNVDFNFPFSPIDDAETIKKSMTDLYTNSLTVLREQINIDEISKAAEMMMDSKHTFMFGIGDTGITVRSFINKVNKLNIYPIFANENGEEDNIAQRLTSTDLAIFTSYDSFESEFGSEIDEASKHDCKTILITSKIDTIYKDKVDLIITVPREEKEKKVATFFSQFAFQYIFNLIFAFLYKNTIL
ncbi:MurR/RpiR family transcriptional regulator [uncultured Lactobacillus sp.]|uniref:MurR/RpiR family transcriptional regulator n=1 Tax=uncultured Lactobacillus sp. TaxID=153152 RepID=UPI0028042F0E|nr:MurR/RpiR family transcriptional regulator [uncultured Lactobacillus sp.]